MNKESLLKQLGWSEELIEAVFAVDIEASQMSSSRLEGVEVFAVETGTGSHLFINQDAGG